jgi:hypothetical protein
MATTSAERTVRIAAENRTVIVVDRKTTSADRTIKVT